MATPTQDQWQEDSQTVTSSQITATHTAETRKSHFVTLVAGWGDADADITLTDGTDTYELRLDVSVNGFSFHLPFTEDTPFQCAPGTAPTITIGDGVQAVTDGAVFMKGYTV